jgi:hypothetical protein
VQAECGGALFANIVLSQRISSPLDHQIQKERTFSSLSLVELSLEITVVILHVRISDLSNDCGIHNNTYSSAKT